MDYMTRSDVKLTAFVSNRLLLFKICNYWTLISTEGQIEGMSPSMLEVLNQHDWEKMTVETDYNLMTTILLSDLNGHIAWMILDWDCEMVDHSIIELDLSKYPINPKSSLSAEKLATL